MTTCDVTWCVRDEPGHVQHHGRWQVDPAAEIAADQDSPEHEVMVRVTLDSPTAEPRLGLAVMAHPDRTLTVRLSADGTRFVRSLLDDV